MKILKTKLNYSNGESHLFQIKWCDSFFSKLQGFTFRTNLASHEGLALVEDHPSVFNTSIHMMFVFTNLAVFWLDVDHRIIHKTMAKPWFPYYASPIPAQYVLELHPMHFAHLEVGQKVDFDNA